MLRGRKNEIDRMWGQGWRRNELARMKSQQLLLRKLKKGKAPEVYVVLELRCQKMEKGL